MEQIFYENGQKMLRWTDKEGNTWEAGYEECEFFGKECFEQMPEPDDNLGSWKVKFNEERLTDCLITTEEDYDYAEDFAEALQKHCEYLREQEIM